MLPYLGRNRVQTNTKRKLLLPKRLTLRATLCAVPNTAKGVEEKRFKVVAQYSQATLKT